MEIAFLIEIILTFLTSYYDTETYMPVKKLKPIANNYIFSGSFIFDVLAVIPYQLLVTEPGDMFNEQNLLRNVLFFKMLRVVRIGAEFIPPGHVVNLIFSFYECDNKDDQLAFDEQINKVVKIINQIFIIIMLTFFFGLIWYRFSDYIQAAAGLDTDESSFFVVKFGLRRPECERDFGPLGDSYLEDDSKRLWTSMYFMLTTFSTVGYGDYYPTSKGEMICGIVIQLFGVTIFASVMTTFQEVLNRGDDGGNREEKLQEWFGVIKDIRNSPFNKGTDINKAMK